MATEQVQLKRMKLYDGTYIYFVDEREGRVVVAKPTMKQRMNAKDTDGDSREFIL